MQNLNVSSNKEINNLTEGQEDVEESIDLRRIASAAGRLAGNLNIQPGALDDFFKKLKLLEHEWHQAERKYKNLQIENDKTVTQLESEKTKCSVLQKKMKFIQDNHKNFEQLKQVYLNMRYQECARKPTVEIRERHSQTDDFPAPDVTAIISSLSRDSLVSVKKSELTEAQENVKALREMVKKREESWSMNVQRERTYKEHISILQHENEMLNQLMKVKNMEIRAMRITEEMNSKTKKEIDVHKRIIAKMNKKLRELEKSSKTMEKYAMNFNEEERRCFEEVIIYKKPKVRQCLSPSKSVLDRPTSSAPVSKQPVRKSARAIPNRKEDSLGEIQELEFLTRVKREIERKQANLKEKVQEKSDDADVLETKE